MRRADRAVVGDGGNGVVEGDDADCAARPGTLEHGAKGGLHAAGAELGSQAGIGEDLGEIRRAGVLAMPELGVRVDEVDRRRRERGLAVDRREHGRVIEHATPSSSRDSSSRLGAWAGDGDRRDAREPSRAVHDVRASSHHPFGRFRRISSKLTLQNE